MDLVLELETGTYINESRVVSVFDIVKYGSFIEASEFSHIFDFVEFRWIHLLDIVTGQCQCLATL